MSDMFALKSSAVFSECGLFRHRLDREVQATGLVFLYSGINGSTAGVSDEDQTSMKWRGFTLRNNGRKYIAVNPFGKTATDVRELAKVADPVGPDNARHVAEAISEADILVPCWGSRDKIPPRLRHHLDAMRDLFFASGKPVKVFGFTKSGDPKHPLMLGYDTPLVDWFTAETDHFRRSAA
ncbi:DUF1643 domain-containing protein [Mesorhizobium ciceri]|uniref:DUF1643 domain-containing protein n=1 Tax=Mesorhizobium TaxID=68287 RepID=UPI0004BA29B8|nr:DUF1643 domain-containing protein [Mesorhizobium ciceri]